MHRCKLLRRLQQLLVWHSSQEFRRLPCGCWLWSHLEWYTSLPCWRVHKEMCMQRKTTWNNQARIVSREGVRRRWTKAEQWEAGAIIPTVSARYGKSQVDLPSSFESFYICKMGGRIRGRLCTSWRRCGWGDERSSHTELKLAFRACDGPAL